jgi:predicted nuclease of restriction endonuclease-like (RecB) superfamily
MSWSHVLALLPVKTFEAKAFYARQAIAGRLGVRGLRELIHDKTFERGEIANAQLGDGASVPFETFRDPYLLDFLGLDWTTATASTTRRRRSSTTWKPSSCRSTTA